MPTKKYNWEKVNWDKPSTLIAKELGIKNLSQVSRMRRKFAPQSIKAMSNREFYDWAKVNWSKASSQISEETGADVSYVSIMRRKLAPSTLQRYNKA